MAMTKRVLGPYYQDDLKADLRVAPVAFMADERTDISNVR